MSLAVILDNIRSVHNVGSIFRTADAVGAEKIMLCGITPMPLDRFNRVRQDFAKVSLGAETTVSWEYAKTTASAIKKLKADGWKIFAVEQSKDAILYNKVPASELRDEKIALVMGQEVKGLSPALLKKCDRILEIPMRGGKESLNVGVAFGIVSYEVGKQ
jgi:23S rRNA (guanosine2251-2'-O)-methyltransferase